MLYSVIYTIILLLTPFIYCKYKQEQEANIYWKFVGIMLVSSFTLHLNNWSLPVGFVIYLAFFKHKKNKSIKQKAAYVGLALFFLQFLIPYIQSYWFEFPRKLAVQEENMYNSPFKDNWSKIQSEFDLVDKDIRLMDFRVVYSHEGSIVDYEFTFMERINMEHHISYKVDFNEETSYLEIKRHAFEGQWLLFDLSIPVTELFRQLEQMDIQKLRLTRDYPFYRLEIQEGHKIHYGVKDAKKYVIDYNKIKEIDNTMLPIEGHRILSCGLTKETNDHYSSCEDYIDFFFNASYNEHDGLITEEEAITFAEENKAVKEWLMKHTDEQIAREQNGKHYVNKDGEWTEVDERTYVKVLKFTPAVKVEKVVDEWHIRYENEYGQNPHEMRVVIDARTGEVESIRNVGGMKDE
ncbi:hypothetical protein ACFSCX_16570 [Bacillus salitolerans]|uniref:Uncharacterized protein n=1 Tax=Bacillus salitolerans TaxID=1437434 RepID=A0ABW4LU21_9BACI